MLFLPSTVCLYRVSVGKHGAGGAREPSSYADSFPSFKTNSVWNLGFIEVTQLQKRFEWCQDFGIFLCHSVFKVLAVDILWPAFSAGVGLGWMRQAVEYGSPLVEDNKKGNDPEHLGIQNWPLLSEGKGKLSMSEALHWNARFGYLCSELRVVSPVSFKNCSISVLNTWRTLNVALLAKSCLLVFLTDLFPFCHRVNAVLRPPLWVCV